jgi:hypothetical protein
MQSYSNRLLGLFEIHLLLTDNCHVIGAGWNALIFIFIISHAHGLSQQDRPAVELVTFESMFLGQMRLCGGWHGANEDFHRVFTQELQGGVTKRWFVRS